MTTIVREECPVCHYVMTKPFEHRCPICLKHNDHIEMPIDPKALLDVKPLPAGAKNDKGGKK